MWKVIQVIRFNTYNRPRFLPLSGGFVFFMDIRLEYNPYEGKFHSARVYDHRTPKGWVCISDRLDNDAANGFIKYMSRSKTRMTVEQVKQHLSDWMWLHQ